MINDATPTIRRPMTDPTHAHDPAGSTEPRDPASTGEGHDADETETVHCPFCEAPIGATARKCRHCREWISRRCERCGTPVRDEWAARGLCAECQRKKNMPVLDQATHALNTTDKSRTIAVVLALVLGGLGFHKFYMGKTGKGILYFLFCWTGIPSLIGIVEGVRYAMMGDEEWERRYFG